MGRLGFRRKTLGLFVVIALAACGGKIDTTELIGSSGSSGSSGGGSVPTALPTSTTSPAPPSSPPNVPGRPPPPPSDECDVSFKGDIIPILAKNSCMNAGCHDDAYGIPPYISDTDIVSTYKSLTTYKILGQPYVNTNGNPSSSSILCNLRGTCGTTMPTFGRVSNPEIARIAAWLRCSAPLN